MHAKTLQTALQGALRLLLLLLLPCLACSTFGGTLADEKFDTLEVGNVVYKNVTVTIKDKDRIFIQHSTGMGNVKVANLTSEARQRLGYEKPPAAASAEGAETSPTDGKSKVADQVLQKLHIQKADTAKARQFMADILRRVDYKIVAMILGFFLLLHLFQSWCCRLICLKAGKEPGMLVWLPILQTFPMLRAAGMSPAWFLGLMVPVLNIIGSVMWCWNIAKARSKGPATALLLMLPLTNFFAFLYLAFSDSVPSKEDKEDKRVESMVLETS
jgi:hypothetical protein